MPFLSVEELKALDADALAAEIAKTTVVNMKIVGEIPNVCYDTFIGRPTMWGNPYRSGRDGTLEEVLKKYEAHVEATPEILDSLWELIGRRLACFCVPKPCHGQVLLRLIKKHCVPHSQKHV
jgi:hypothetical protein